MFISFINDLVNAFDINWMDAITDIYTKAGPVISPLLWIFFPWLESIASPIPLTLIIGLNISSAKDMFGTFLGYLIGFSCSYLGEVLGAITVFLFHRFVTKPLVLKGIIRKKEVKPNKNINPSSGSAGLIAITMIPFVPTVAINLIYGFSSMKVKTFIYSTLVGKTILILLLSFCSPIIELMMSNLLYMAIGLIFTGVLFFFIKKNENVLDGFIQKIINKLQKNKKEENTNN
ncbi:MAG: TVP38/TMEM64 family protein [Erysipelotrichaceae bacterium]|nr:TVP38/TMEM64 family protein [Erysipelotrichaceae bacterium]